MKTLTQYSVAMLIVCGTITSFLGDRAEATNVLLLAVIGLLVLQWCYPPNKGGE